MLVTAVVFALSWVIGVIGWAQIVGSLQNLRKQRKYLFTLFLWAAILAAAAYVAITKFNGLVPLLAGYVVALAMVLSKGKVK